MDPGSLSEEDCKDEILKLAPCSVGVLHSSVRCRHLNILPLQLWLGSRLLYPPACNISTLGTLENNPGDLNFFLKFCELWPVPSTCQVFLGTWTPARRGYEGSTLPSPPEVQGDLRHRERALWEARQPLASAAAEPHTRPLGRRPLCSLPPGPRMGGQP